MSDNFTDKGIPAKMEITRNVDHLQIVWKWLGLRFYLLTPFAIILDVSLLFWIILAFLLDDPLITLLFLSLHAAASIGMTYYTLAGYLNRTVIDVDVNFLTIKHVPLLFRNHKKIPSHSLEQLYCTKRGYPQAGKDFYPTCDIYAITNEPLTVQLLSDMDGIEQALFVEHEIEKFLNIEDRPVKGALNSTTLY